MSLRLRSITIDCLDPYRLVAFWGEATGYVEDPDNPNAPDDPEGYLVSPGDGPNLLFIHVDDDRKVGKNRLHLDVVPIDRTRDEEVGRLIGLGARQIDDRRRPDGAGWVVLADPEDNEFCVERGEAERAG